MLQHREPDEPTADPLRPLRLFARIATIICALFPPFWLGLFISVPALILLDGLHIASRFRKKRT